MAAHDADYSMDGDQALTEVIHHRHVSIGIGCSSLATRDEVIRLIASSIDSIPSGTVLATLDRRASMGEVVASTLGLRLMLFSAKTLASVRGTTTYSSIALDKIRTANVAEASALAALGPSASLIAPQTKGRFCTCAVAAVSIAEGP